MHKVLKRYAGTDQFIDLSGYIRTYIVVLQVKVINIYIYIYSWNVTIIDLCMNIPLMWSIKSIDWSIFTGKIQYGLINEHQQTVKPKPNFIAV